ncbi:MAG: tetratricopeptide (TPR) repeat protein [Cognaticolwellia sp.]
MPKLHHRARNAYVRAHLYRSQGELEQAAHAYQRAMVFDPSSAVLVQELGELRAEQGKQEAAAALLERAIELGGGDSARGSLCAAQMALGEPVSVLSGWSPEPAQGWIWARCVHRAFPERDPQDLLDAVDGALALNAYSASAWETGAELVHAHQRYATGLGWVERALAPNPWDAQLLEQKLALTQDLVGRDRHLPARTSALRQLASLGEPVGDALAESLARDLARPPECGVPSPSCGLQARCLVSNGENVAAAEKVLSCTDMSEERRYEQALAWNPALWRVLRGSVTSPAVKRAGVRLALDAGEPKAALAQLQSLSDQDPYHPKLEGLALLAVGLDARDALARGHERLPGDRALMAALAQAHYQQGDVEQADAWAASAALNAVPQ